MAKKAAKKSVKKKAAAPKKKAAAKKKVAAKKPAAKKVAPKKKAAAKKAAAKKKAAPAKKKAKAPAKKAPSKNAAKASASANGAAPPAKKKAAPKKPVKITGFLLKQNQKLLALRDSLVDAMTGMAQDNLRGSANGGDNSAFGMHQADAGSDAYDRDFALNLLSKEQDALYEIDEALKRIQNGYYGICEMSGKKIMKARLEAIPFTRLTVECQAQLEKELGGRATRRPRGSNFGLSITGKEPEERTKESLDDD